MASHAPLRYLSAWFCPYAHRATIALEHHARRVPYEWVEALGWERRASADANRLEQEGEPAHENWYHWKHPELVEKCPGGLVPTLVDAKGRAVWESLVAVEYVDDLARERGAADEELLLPAEPYLRAQARIEADAANKTLCSPYYRVLVRTDPTERKLAFDEMVEDLRAFERKLAGPMFFGDRLSLVDIALVPWAWRFYVLEHYRGPEFAVPASLGAYHKWLAHVTSLPQVAKTLPDRQAYLEHVGRYADASARSKVANAVRAGRAAHDIDDRKDGHPA